jgi:hypothetical protein
MLVVPPVAVGRIGQCERQASPKNGPEKTTLRPLNATSMAASLWPLGPERTWWRQ